MLTTYRQERWRKPMVLVELCVPMPIWPFPDKILRQWRESSMVWRDRRISTKSPHLKGPHSNSNSHWLLGNSNGYNNIIIISSISFFMTFINTFIFVLQWADQTSGWKYNQPKLRLCFLTCRKFWLKVWPPSIKHTEKEPHPNTDGNFISKATNKFWR
jgi:hypothetical protein